MCTDSVDDVLGSVTAVYAGTNSSAAGVGCTAKFAFVVAATDDTMNDYSAAVARSCRWCSGASAASVWGMTGLTPPVTADRKISGISWWAADSDTTSKSWLKRKGDTTATKMIGTDVASGNCAVSPAATVIR